MSLFDGVCFSTFSIVILNFRPFSASFLIGSVDKNRSLNPLIMFENKNISNALFLCFISNNTFQSLHLTCTRFICARFTILTPPLYF